MWNCRCSMEFSNGGKVWPVSEFDDVVQMHRMAWAMGEAVAGVREMLSDLESDLEDLRNALRDMHIDGEGDIEDNE